MYCLKCGRDTAGEQVFCSQCLKAMEQYPVKPGTAIQLPHHEDAPFSRKAYRRMPTAEEQLSHMGKTVRFLGLLVAVLSLLLCLTAGFLIHTLQDRPVMPGDMGRNYTAVPSSDEP